MPKGQYNVSYMPVQPRRDVSFHFCLCTMFLVSVLVGAFLIAVSKTSPFYQPRNAKPSNVSSPESWHGNSNQPTTHHKPPQTKTKVTQTTSTSTERIHDEKQTTKAPTKNIPRKNNNEKIKNRLEIEFPKSDPPVTTTVQSTPAKIASTPEKTTTQTTNYEPITNVLPTEMSTMINTTNKKSEIEPITSTNKDDIIETTEKEPYSISNGLPTETSTMETSVPEKTTQTTNYEPTTDVLSTEMSTIINTMDKKSEIEPTTSTNKDDIIETTEKEPYSISNGLPSETSTMETSVPEKTTQTTKYEPTTDVLSTEMSTMINTMDKKSEIEPITSTNKDDIKETTEKEPYSISNGLPTETSTMETSVPEKTTQTTNYEPTTDVLSTEMSTMINTMDKKSEIVPTTSTNKDDRIGTTEKEPYSTSNGLPNETSTMETFVPETIKIEPFVTTTKIATVKTTVAESDIVFPTNSSGNSSTEIKIITTSEYAISGNMNSSLNLSVENLYKEKIDEISTTSHESSTKFEVPTSSFLQTENCNAGISNRRLELESVNTTKTHLGTEEITEVHYPTSIFSEASTPENTTTQTTNYEPTTDVLSTEMSTMINTMNKKSEIEPTTSATEEDTIETTENIKTTTTETINYEPTTTVLITEISTMVNSINEKSEKEPYSTSNGLPTETSTMETSVPETTKIEPIVTTTKIATVKTTEAVSDIVFPTTSEYAPESPTTTSSSTSTGQTNPSTSSSTKCESTPVEDKKFCKTDQCYSTASRLLSLVDVNIDPCEDFYSYACGGINRHIVVENDLTIDVWNRMERGVKHISALSPSSHHKFKSYYEGCVDYDSLVTMEERKKGGKAILESIGTFIPLGEDDFVPDMITDLLIKLLKHGSAPLFNLQLDIDPSNSGHFQVVLMPSTILFSDSHFLTGEEKTKSCRYKAGDHIENDTNKVYEDYLNCLNNQIAFLNATLEALHFFGVFDNMTKNVSVSLTQDISMSVENLILESIKGLTAKDYFNATKLKNTKPEKVQKLHLSDPNSGKHIAEVNWGSLFENLLKIEEHEDVAIQVYFIEKVTQMFSNLYEPKEQRQMYNALLAVFAHDLYKELVTTHHRCDRERYCLRVAASLMPSVAANLYMGTFPKSDMNKLRSEVNKMNIKLTKEILNNLGVGLGNWTDTTTLREIKYKIEDMKFRPPEMFNESNNTENLEKCDLEKKNYLYDSICLMQQFQEQLYSRIKMDPEQADVMWLHFSKPFSAETTFVYGLNTLLVPLPVMGPVYDKEMPKHVVEARLGNLLARGLGLCFDPTGVQFSSRGKSGAIISEASNPTYKNAVDDALYDEIDLFIEDGHTFKYKPDPSLTLNDRLADITADNLAFNILLNQTNDTSLPWVPFTSKQVYFITLAQEFCSKRKLAEMIPSIFEGRMIPSHRVGNIMMNSKHFGKVFNCPVGSKMNKIHGTKIKPFPLYCNEEDDCGIED